MKGIEMKKGKIGVSKAWFVITMISAFLILPVNAVFALDIYNIIMWDTEYREDGSPLESFEFAAGVSGDGITQVTITPPGGSPIALSSSLTDPFFWGFSDETYDTLAALRAAYQAGNYVFTFNGGADSVTVNHNPTIPTGFANITYPANGATDVPLNPVFTWDSSVSYGDALNTAVAEEEMEGLLDTQVLIDIAQTSWAVGPLNPGILHWLEVAVFAGTESQPYILETVNSDLFEYYDLFENCNMVFFTTISPVLDDDLDIERIYMGYSKDYLDGTAISNPWFFMARIDFADTGSLASIEMTLPDGVTTYSLDNENGTWEYRSWPTVYPTLTAVRTDYPEGIYTFYFHDGSGLLIKSVQLDFSGLTEPGGTVDFTYPSYNGQTDISTNPTFTWTVDSGAGDILVVSLDDYSEVTVPMFVPMDTLSWQPGPLDPEQDYRLYVDTLRIKDWTGGPGFPTETVGDDTFEYVVSIGYHNDIAFTTAASLADPIEEIEEILDFIDDSVGDGTLAGEGLGNSADNRLNALRNKLEEAQGLIEAGLYEEACDQLWSIYKKCDGESRPPDFVTGEAAEDLADMILLIMDELGCG